MLREVSPKNPVDARAVIKQIIAPGCCGCEDIAVYPDYYGKSWDYTIRQLINKGFRHVQTVRKSDGWLSVYQKDTLPLEIIHVHGNDPV